MEIAAKSVAIVRFGPGGFSTDGFTPGQYYQVTIDPSKVSPSGEFIRFGENQGDEITGWQRVKALTIVEVLGEWADANTPPIMTIGKTGVTMLATE
jgi:hypothetical protein